MKVGALGRFIMGLVMWIALAVGLVMSALAGLTWYAMQNAGAENGPSAGESPEVGLIVLGVLALISFALALFLRREVRRSKAAAEATDDKKSSKKG